VVLAGRQELGRIQTQEVIAPTGLLPGDNQPLLEGSGVNRARRAAARLGRSAGRRMAS